ncbi:membrane-bound protein LytR [Spirochaeta thermophila DSM 6578]|uniref:Membrane-bound protein LytR n=1 Tax=Winmispira thermophila (strain ATCC 700085 / DSM 6578 / Z-1203) TaxID=869211 RepID=G0GDI2_WINT7|nr:LCP family protein [Spirochaeta thermophila]AEJ61329.1 membrane-bound protein LytR [Spirochaeta thermophila DSM 6578]
MYDTRMRSSRLVVGLILGGIVLTILAVGFLVYSHVRVDDFTMKAGQKEVISFLWVVYDEEGGLMTEVLFYDPSRGNLAFLDVPFNTGMLFAELERIDSLDYAYRQRGISYLKKYVESLLGVEMDFVFEISLENLGKVVDLLEGIEVFIPEEISIKEPHRVLLPSGNVRLDGAKARQLVLYAARGKGSPPSDPEATSLRQQFFQSFISSCAQHPLLHHDKVVRLFLSLFSSSMNASSFRHFRDVLGNAHLAGIVTQRVLGKISRVEEQDLLIPHFQGDLLRQTVQHLVGLLKEDSALSPIERRVTLQILNGTTVQGLARRTATLFEGFGYEVVSIGNAESDQEEYTRIIDRRGDPERAQNVARIIHCTRVESLMDSDPPADITIILGRDFDGRYCKE